MFAVERQNTEHYHLELSPAHLICREVRKMKSTSFLTGGEQISEKMLFILDEKVKVKCHNDKAMQVHKHALGNIVNKYAPLHKGTEPVCNRQSYMCASCSLYIGGGKKT